VVGAPLLVGASAVALLVSAAAWARVPSDGAPSRRPAEATSRAGRADILAVWPVLAMFAIATLGTGLLNASIPPLLVEAGAPRSAYGVGLGIIGGGLLLGQLSSGAFRRSLVRRRTIAVALLCMAVAAMLIGATPLLTTTLLALFAVGLFDGITETIFDTLVQQGVPEARHATIFGLADGLFTSTMLAGLALAPLVSQVVPVSRLPLLAGGALAVAGAAGLALDRSRASDDPAPSGPRGRLAQLLWASSPSDAPYVPPRLQPVPAERGRAQDGRWLL
jgi:predicted MFS family arabinose efflux permease